MGTHPVSADLRLHVSGARPSGDPECEAEEAGGGAQAGGRIPPGGAKPEELGNSRGKRMAMKFVNKIANKEKYTQVGLVTHYVTLRKMADPCAGELPCCVDGYVGLTPACTRRPMSLGGLPMSLGGFAAFSCVVDGVLGFLGMLTEYSDPCEVST